MSPQLRRARLAVLLVFALNGLVMATWMSRVPALRDAFDLTSSQLGLVLLAMTCGAVLALPLAGPLVARLGARRMVRVGSVVSFLGLLTVASAPSVPVLVVGLVAVSAGSATWDVAMNIEGTQVEQLLARSVMATLHAAFSVGTVLGALLGAAATALGLSLTWHLSAVAVIALVLAQVACGSFLPHQPSAAGGGGQGVRAAWREPRTLAVGLLVLVFAFAEGTANDWLALALVDGYRVSNAIGVLGFAVFVTAMTVGRLVGSVLLDRFGRVPVLRVSAATAAAGVLSVVLGGSAPVALIGAVLWGCGAALGFPVGISAAGEEPARAAGRVSVVSSIGYTAFLGGPPLIGFLAHRFGPLPALWSVLVLLALVPVLSRACGRRVGGSPARA